MSYQPASVDDIEAMAIRVQRIADVLQRTADSLRKQRKVSIEAQLASMTNYLIPRLENMAEKMEADVDLSLDPRNALKKKRIDERARLAKLKAKGTK